MVLVKPRHHYFCDLRVWGRVKQMDYRSRIPELTCRLIKVIVDYLFPLFEDNERKSIAKVTTSLMFQVNRVTRENVKGHLAFLSQFL